MPPWLRWSGWKYEGGGLIVAMDLFLYPLSFLFRIVWTVLRLLIYPALVASRVAARPFRQNWTSQHSGKVEVGSVSGKELSS